MIEWWGGTAGSSFPLWVDKCLVSSGICGDEVTAGVVTCKLPGQCMGTGFQQHHGNDTAEPGGWDRIVSDDSMGHVYRSLVTEDL